MMSMVNNLSSLSLHKNGDNREMCGKLNAVFPLCTLSQRGIQEEQVICYLLYLKKLWYFYMNI